MLSWTCAFLGGTVLPTTWPSLPPFWVLFVLLMIAFLMLVFSHIYSSSWSKVAAAFLLGIFWCCYKGYETQLRIPEAYFNTPVTLSGYITNFPEHSSGRIRFEYRIESIK